jgi:hypothetical protein
MVRIYSAETITTPAGNGLPPGVALLPAGLPSSLRVVR